MRSEIVENLGKILNEAPTDKMRVMYALVEIRKVLEHDSAKKALWTLTFFCDWAVHTKLTGEGARAILKMLDERLSQYNPTEPWNVDPDGGVLRFLSFDLFNHSLQEFCRQHELPTAWTEDMFFWKEFVIIFGDIVRNTPLIVNRENRGLRYLKRLEMTACEPVKEIVEANPEQKHHGFRWEFELDDGRTFRLPYTSNVPNRPQNWQTQGRR